MHKSLLAFFLFFAVCLSGQKKSDSTAYKLSFISADRKWGKDSIVHFYNSALFFLETNEDCITSDTLYKFRLPTLSELYFNEGEVKNNKMYKKGFLEKVNYQTYMRLRKEQNLLYLKPCLKQIDSSNKNRQYRGEKAGGRLIHFSEILEHNKYFYFRALVSYKELSHYITFKFSSFSEVESFWIEEVIF